LLSISRINSTEHYIDRKYHSGVLEGVQRSPATPSLKSPPFVKTNISLFALPAGDSTLYFCPDRVLIYSPTGINAVGYSDLRLISEACRFVESEGVFSDHQVVGTTWRYVNKDGGPDRRFRDNPQLPIVLYEELHIKSPGGLNEVYQFSKPGVRTELAEAIKDLGRVLALSKFWADVARASTPPRHEDGIWCRYVDGEIALRIASTRSESFMKKLQELRSVCNGPNSKPECALIIEALIGTILLDWAGLTHEGRPFLFSFDNARAVLSQSVELLAFTTQQSHDLAGSELLDSNLVFQSHPPPLPRPENLASRPAPRIIDTTLLPEADVTNEDEELVEKCLEIIRQEKRASTSLLQRRLRLGYTRAARIVDILEQRGILGPGEGAKPREILVDLDAAV
jgi:Ftsk gamma domain